MQRATTNKKTTTTVQEFMAGLDSGEDPRRVMARLNAAIVNHQRAGEEVPASLLRLSQVIATECAAQSQGR